MRFPQSICNFGTVTVANPVDYLDGSGFVVVGDHNLLIEITGGCDFCDGVSYASGSYKKDPHLVYT
jgi:hypothetical protein